MIRWHWYVPFTGGRTMPEFTTVPVHEAQLRTSPGRHGQFINEYADYIQQLSSGQAGNLSPTEKENPATIRRRLKAVATALDTKLIIMRSGENVYFWKEDGAEEEPSRTRGRRGRAGDLLLPIQSFSKPPRVEPGVIEEESPELGQLASEAERRVAQG
jgi:hypothetical protein